jgi:predicted alpha/beta superfamily hydrolase
MTFSDCPKTARIVLLSVVAALPLVTAESAPYAMRNTFVHSLPTSANQRNYDLYVRVPESYATSPTRSYQVVYVCDGYWDFPLVTACVANAFFDDAAPEVIVVGIGYPGVNPDVGFLRTWDLTPTVDRSFDQSGTNSGHAQEFLSVIENQFIPFIQSNYQVDPSFRVLTGSSLGGLFALYAMFERPELFDGFIVPSPSLWWNSNGVQARAQAWGNSGAAMNARVFLSYSTEDYASNISTTRSFALELQNQNIPGIEFAVRDIEGERHSSAKAEAYNRGLRFMFADVASRPPSLVKPGFGSPGTMISLSTRGRVGDGDDKLIAGIYVSGILPKRILVRAAGPALGALGVANPLPDPRFDVVDRFGTIVASNDNWGSSSNPVAVESARSRTGGFVFAAGSRDAAEIVSLPPGGYTIVVESADGSTSGVSLVEAYELLP